MAPRLRAPGCASARSRASASSASSRFVAGERPLAGLALMARSAYSSSVLPAADALRGIEQNRFHHLDVHRITLWRCSRRRSTSSAIRRRSWAHENGAAVSLPRRAAGRRANARRRAALRCAPADIGQLATRDFTPEGNVDVPRPRSRGRPHLARGVDAPAREPTASVRTSPRWPSITFASGSSGLHPRTAGSPHRPPLPLRACQPVEVDAYAAEPAADRLATRGENAEPAIAAHLDLAQRGSSRAALDWRARPPGRRRRSCAATTSRRRWGSSTARGSASCSRRSTRPPTRATCRARTRPSRSLAG